MSGKIVSETPALSPDEQLAAEYALGLLPTKRAVVKTPTDAVYTGLHVNASVCGVSVIRSGEAMENALRSCWKGIDIGKILVQRRHHGVATPVNGSVSPPRRGSGAEGAGGERTCGGGRPRCAHGGGRARHLLPEPVRRLVACM